MPWVRLDDQFHAHPKLSGLGALTLPAVGLHLIALTWCSHYLTDGLIPAGQVRKFGGSRKLTDALVGATLWEATEGGFRIHDYLVYNPSREKVLVQRQSDADRKRSGRESGQRPPGLPSPSVAESERNPPVPSLSRPSPVPSRVLPDSLSGATALQKLAEELTGKAYAIANLHGGLGARAADQLERHGLPDLERAWRSVASRHERKPTIRQLVFEAEDLLDPVEHVNGKAKERADRERQAEADRKRIERETEATRRRNAELYGEGVA